ncbi:PTS glucose/sucrose transporter subunit IIB [Streptomyces heilongjiangensis]|uniref:PTS glucose/sucrose transporter subunit IIB n=1 Tax=Streptomyces heilongjiangensis TaxID=945052 RepID=A0ABW1B6C5_9ACTN|nr:PTS glucose/sucrose transporter subunit IIB [Streptomyces heilongjiangensis]MDC2946984.1 PTS glucose/sucrose transporter subunit IIB [Streptomyces heilongjiangensis]
MTARLPARPFGDHPATGVDQSWAVPLPSRCHGRHLTTGRRGRPRHRPPRGRPRHHAPDQELGTTGRIAMATKAEKIVAGLGGLDNIDEIEGCITRLRTEVNDPSLVDEAALKAAGAHGVVKMGTAVQVVIGTDADPIAAEIEDMM